MDGEMDELEGRGEEAKFIVKALTRMTKYSAENCAPSVPSS
jgi:hypothetical protein